MSVAEEKKRTWISDLVMDAAMTLERSFTPEEACIYVAEKMNTKPGKVKSRVILGIKRGKKDGTLKPRGKNKYSLAGDSDESLEFFELEEKCGKRRKRKKSCKVAKKKRKSSCKKKVVNPCKKKRVVKCKKKKAMNPCKKKKRKKKSCKPKRRRRKSRCAKKRKPSKAICDLCKKKRRRRKKKPKKDCKEENKNGGENNGDNPPESQSVISLNKRQTGVPSQPSSSSTKNQAPETT